MLDTININLKETIMWSISMSEAALWRLERVLDRTGESRPDLYRKMKRGEFPRPFLVPGNDRIKVWDSREVQSYINGVITNAPRENMEASDA